MAKLDEAQINARMEREFPEWSVVGDALTRTFQFQNFVESIAFVGAVARAAEAAKHHPDILIRYRKVTLTLSTHDAGGMTEKDFGLAETLDAIAQTMLSTSK